MLLELAVVVVGLGTKQTPSNESMERVDVHPSNALAHNHLSRSRIRSLLACICIIIN